MFQVGVAVNSKRTVYEARSMEIWPQHHPNFAIQESRLQAAGSPWSSGKSKDHARSFRWDPPKHGGACCEKPSENWQRMT